MRRRLSPTPTSVPFGELIVVGVAAIALGACAGRTHGEPPTCGPCCHGSHGPECNPVQVPPEVPDVDAATNEVDAADANVDAGTTTESANDPTMLRDAGAAATTDAPVTTPARDAGVGRRRRESSNTVPDRHDEIRAPAPTCGPRCHGGDPNDPSQLGR